MSEQTKSWQSRIAEATDAVAAKFVESISYDRRIYKQDIAGSVAHATMLAKVGLITDAERDAIVAGLRSIERDIEAGTFAFDESLEDIHMVVEAALIERVGDPGRKLHTGRSRNDQVALDLMLWIESAANLLANQLDVVCKAFASLATRSNDVVMPSFTHLQRAQPINAGAEALAWATMFSRDEDRVALTMTSRGPEDCPLGSGAIAGSSLPLEAGFTSELLEFSTRTGPQNSIESTASRDRACDFLYACAMIAQHLSRWAEQWIIYMTTEFGFIKIADRYTTSSSMMPQKRNPDMLELIRGRCGNVYGDLFALMTILKGLPIGYNRDLQEDKRIVFRAYDTVSSCLTMAAAIVNSAEYDKARIEPTLDRGFLDATSLAEYLVTLGVPFRTAHGVVGTLVARCEGEGKHALAQLPVEAFNDVLATKTDVRVDAGVYECLGAANVVRRYRSAGAGRRQAVRGPVGGVEAAAGRVAGPAPIRSRLAAWFRQRTIWP